jgi:asparagine synthase (glutamine-hydrolysing)
MDNDLVNFAMKCPVDLKVKNLFNRPRLDENQIGNKKETYFQQTSDGKSILRKVMSEIIPPSITDGPKKGFSSPDASWFMNDSASFVRKRLLAGGSGLLGLFDIHVVSELVDSHLAGTENRRLLIWSLLTQDSLLRQKES